MALLYIGEWVLVGCLFLAGGTDVVVGAGVAVPAHPNDRVTVALVAPVTRVDCHHFVELRHHFVFGLAAGG